MSSLPVVNNDNRIRFNPEKLSMLVEINGTQKGVLAKRIEVSYHTLRRWLIGETAPDANELARICNFYHVPVTYFFERY